MSEQTTQEMVDEIENITIENYGSQLACAAAMFRRKDSILAALRTQPSTGLSEQTDVEHRVAWAMAEVIAKRHGDEPEYWMSDERREEARAAIAALSPERVENERLREALAKAAGWFEEYAQNHDAKMREAVDSFEKASRADKAIRNAERAKELRRALANTGESA